MLTEQETARLKRIFTNKKDLEHALEWYEKKEEHEFDFNYLVEHMATKEDLVDLENRIEQKVENKFVTYLAPIVSRLDTHDEMFRSLDRKFDHVMNVLDKLAASFSFFREEYAVSVVQYQRQLEWNHKVAEKVGIPFDY